MADEKTNADSMAIYHTWFTTEAPTVAIGLVGRLAPPYVFPDEPETIDPDDSFGGFTASTRADQCGWIADGTLRGVKIERVSGANSSGTGCIEAAGDDQLRFTGPSGSAGDAVTIAAGETKLLEDGADGSKFVIVTRDTSDDLAGSLTVTFLPIFNNVFGMSDLSNDEGIAGETKLRCVSLSNVNTTYPIENLKVWLKTRGEMRLGTTGLPASGAGQITITGPTWTFSSWPQSGYCRIESSTDVLKEIVYYSSRTDTVRLE